MDQMNLLPNNAQRLESSRDLLQTASNSWIAHSHGPSISPWPSQPLPFGSFYFAQQQAFQRPAAGALGPTHPMHSGQHGTLPPPDRSVRGIQAPESYTGLPAAAVYWSSTMQPMPMNSSGASMSSVPSTFENMNANARDLGLRPPITMDWAPPGATSGTHSVSFPQISSSEGLPNTSGHPVGPSTAISHFPLSPISPRRPGQTSSPTSYRSHRSQTCETTFPSICSPLITLHHPFLFDLRILRKIPFLFYRSLTNSAQPPPFSAIVTIATL